MLAVERPEQAAVDLPARGVLDHADLLPDDAALFRNVSLGKIGRKHEFQQDFEIFLEAFGAGEVIRGHGVARKGVRACAGAGELLEGVSVLVLEHLVLKEVRDTGRGVEALSLEGKGPIDRAEIGRENGERLGKAVFGDIADAQAVREHALADAFTQFGIVSGHRAAPFMK